MTWINGPVEVRNNIMAGTSGNCLLCVEDYSKQLTAEQMKVTALGNVYQRSNTSSPGWVAVWSTGLLVRAHSCPGEIPAHRLSDP